MNDITKQEFISKFWNYYLLLEEEYISIEKTIPLDQQNLCAYSPNYQKLLLSICSEIDTLFREWIIYASNKPLTEKKSNMDSYRKIVSTRFNDFQYRSILVRYSDLKFCPFSNWNDDLNPAWWKVHNKIKHNRVGQTGSIDNVKQATQENTVQALSGLYLLGMYFYKSILDKTNDEAHLRIPVPQSKRFRIENWAENEELIDNRYILYINDTGHLILDGALE